MSKKPFFYRIDAGKLLDFATDPEGENLTLVQFAKMLVKGESDLEYISQVIEEAKEFSAKKRKAADKRWNSEKSKADAVHVQCMSTAMPEAVTEAVQKDNNPPLSPIGGKDKISDVCNAWRKAIGKTMLNGTQISELKRLVDKNGKQKVMEAIETTAANGANMNYLKAVCSGEKKTHEKKSNTRRAIEVLGHGDIFDDLDTGRYSKAAGNPDVIAIELQPESGGYGENS